jgi:hypothetical protein
MHTMTMDRRGMLWIAREVEEEEEEQPDPRPFGQADEPGAQTPAPASLRSVTNRKPPLAMPPAGAY